MPILHLTYRQNQRGFSWSRGLIADAEDPTREQIRAAVAALPPDTTPVYLAGGEPTLRPDLPDILRELSETLPKRDLVMVSDGRLFRDVRFCDGFSAVRAARLIVEVVFVSTRAGVHDDVVDAENSFDRARQGVRNLLSRGRRTRIRIAVGRHNLNHLHEIADRIPDLFPGIDGVVWDAGMFARSALEVLPDEAAGYLESAIHHLRSKGVRSAIARMPACALSANYRDDVDTNIAGEFPADCGPCQWRAKCPGLTESVAGNPAFLVHPIVPQAVDAQTAAYEKYIFALLEKYVPAEARAAGSVLDAMCGEQPRILPLLRRFFASATSVRGADIALAPMPAPEGTTIFHADFLGPFDSSVRPDFIALIHPPANSPALPMDRVASNLSATLHAGGCFFVVLAEHTDVEFMVAALQRAGLAILVSEANSLRTNIEPEHKWVIVCRKRP